MTTGNARQAVTVHGAFYHCAPMSLEVGSVIRSGNWGRIVRATSIAGVNDGTSKIIFELAYENSRLLHNPSAPSRLDCIFCCPTLDEAQAYREAQQPTGIIYKVLPLDPSTPIHVTSWLLWGLGTGSNFTQSQKRLKDYWTATPTEQREVLVGGPVQIIDIVGE